MYCNKLLTVGNFAYLFNCTPVGRTSDSMTLRNKDASIDEMYELVYFGCCQARRDLHIPVGFLLLRYSVLCTVESLSLRYLLFIS